MTGFAAYAVALMIVAHGSDGRLPRPPLPTTMPRVLYAPCPGLEAWWVQGCTIGDTVYLHPDRGIDRLNAARVLAHELGHVVDEQNLTDDERHQFAEHLGRAGDPWRLDDNGNYSVRYYRRSVVEAFAEAYAHCQINRRERVAGAWRAWWYDQRGRALARTCQLIRQLALPVTEIAGS